MKKMLYVLLALILLSNFTLTVNAKDRSDVIRKGGFIELSDEDMEDTINSLVSKISRELELPYTPRVSCYEYDWAVMAHNTLYPIGDYGPTICVNLRPFKADMTTNIVFTIAHEVRHSYQYEHQNDDSDYGRACYNGLHNYNSWYADIGAYYSQWLEQDANEYATQYADKYFGAKRSE